MSRFDACFEFVVGAEGGYVNDPNDPGGETIWGITRRDHPEAWAQGRPTIEAAKAIYRKQYWDVVRGDDWPEGYDLAVFDAAINQGTGPAVMMAQKALGVTIDGKAGPQTVSAARAAGREGIALCLAERALRYAQTRGFDRYGKGWLKRTYLLAMEV